MAAVAVTVKILIPRLMVFSLNVIDVSLPQLNLEPGGDGRSLRGGSALESGEFPRSHLNLVNWRQE